MFFFKQKNIDYSPILHELEKGNETALEKLLWQPKKGVVEYLPVTTEMLLKFKKPTTESRYLSIHQKIRNGKFELLIMNVPWSNSEHHFRPLIFNKDSQKIVGIMLPFNELHEHLSLKEQKQISDLGIEWTGFILPYSFK